MAGGDRDRRGGGRNRRDGAGGSGRDGRMMSREVQVSKALSKLLRHGAEKEGLKLGAGGYINVQDVLKSRTIRPMKVTLSELSSLVASNEKQRFSLIPVPSSTEPQSSQPQSPNTGPASEGQAASEQISALQTTEASSSATDDFPHQLISALTLNDTDDPSNYLIRANQGHSIKIADNQGLLTPILAPATNANDSSSSNNNNTLPAYVVHGTTQKAWPLILASGGLKPMGRNHVHFATGLPAGFQQQQQSQTSSTDPSAPDAVTTATATPTPTSSEPVISGMRNSSSILVFLDLPKALAMGLLFWRSANGVVLCDGGAEQLIPLACFKSVEKRGIKGGILVVDGVVVRDLTSWKD